MREVQLYIDNKRIDLFKDEVVSITQSIQNIKEPAEIFTDFTKSFTIPANNENNKIFRHYYNYDIFTGFDARVKTAGEIRLNHVKFRKGFIKLEGVDMKDNKPFAYRITFFGETVSLKDILGEDKLNALAWLDNFSVVYSPTNVKSYLSNGYSPTVQGVVYPAAIVTPLITHTNRLFYDSTAGHELLTGFENNLFYDTGTGHEHGVLWSDLKYSIRVHLIIKAIEVQYGIVFSSDFFSVSNINYYNLYMWMHRKKGNVQDENTTTISKAVNTWSTFTMPDVASNGSGFIVNSEGFSSEIYSELTITPANPALVYSFKVYKDGELYYQRISVTGTQIYYDTGVSDGVYTVFLESPFEMTFSSLSYYWEKLFYDYELDDYIVTDVNTSTATSVSLTSSFTFYPTQQLTEIKIIDFLKGLFNMFNLTAYVKDDVIIVDTLDNYYATFNEYDITKYIDITDSTVDVALPYKQIDFIYADYKTFLANNFNKLNAKEFGELKYKGDDIGKWVGSLYKLSLPFQKMLYERLTNINGGALTTIQYGYMVDDNQQPYIGSPLLHYVVRQISGTVLSFRDATNARSQVGTFYIPTNTSVTTNQSLNFNVEVDEYSLNTNEETLFKNYHKNYIEDIFNKKSRLVKLKAFLPLKILLAFDLSDRFIINSRRFKINSITTNLQTGESQLELINDI